MPSDTFTHNTNAPIGIFDSGVGGLSIAKRISEHLPNEQLIYFADSQFAPYGDISNQQIIERVNFIADTLITKQCKAIVIACNTATVNAIDQLRNRVTLPIIGVEPAIKPAARISTTQKIGILVTQATANNARFLALVEQYKNGAQVFIQPCLGLVELIEQGLQTSDKFIHLLEQYLAPLIAQGIDTLVLGCTHYPFMSEAIKKIMPSGIELIETATPVSEQLKRQLIKHHLLAKKTSNLAHQFYSSSETPTQNKIFSQLWGTSINVELYK
ncbi:MULTISPECIES: glutamate racemase [Thalassotalea]|uniref:Glutamate racemase n=1 Tax=Thalassotalea castellviae TaxID=3075612 RepID=A0ABU2ZWQ3_9GAMM|nr:glutamate racemase [Thalassotalea sp. W431]MDT0602365.1 glutamate racemase [Thalassotalea sp. W431]